MHSLRLAARPDLIGLHATRPGRYPALLESAARGGPNGRFDILFAFPGEVLTLAGDGVLSGPHAGTSHDFLEALDAWFRAEQVAASEQVLPFCGGWFLFLGYELAGQVEPTLGLARSTAVPTAFALRIPAAVVRDHRTGATWAIAEAQRPELLDAIRDDLASASPRPGSGPRDILAGEVVEEPPERYLEAVRRAKAHIVDGDVFQANLSREWTGRLLPGISDAQVYRRLRAANPGPFAGLVRWGESAILSSSPERLLRVRRDGIVETRPIAGTRPRGAHPGMDAALSRELIAHPKERAEHVMLIDLERNDLGRVCRPGTVAVDEMMVIESYAHVHHIVSNVRGELLPGTTPGRVIRAVFPGGTITGCPKVRCMEIIDRLEGAARGPYTGSIGYLDRDGACDLNILIRTLVRHGDRVSVRAGAGIVADSIPEREVEETRAKARGLLVALAAGADTGLAALS